MKVYDAADLHDVIDVVMTVESHENLVLMLLEDFLHLSGIVDTPRPSQSLMGNHNDGPFQFFKLLPEPVELCLPDMGGVSPLVIGRFFVSIEHDKIQALNVFSVIAALHLPQLHDLVKGMSRIDVVIA